MWFYPIVVPFYVFLYVGYGLVLSCFRRWCPGRCGGLDADDDVGTGNATFGSKPCLHVKPRCKQPEADLQSSSSSLSSDSEIVELFKNVNVRFFRRDRSCQRECYR